MSCMLQLKWQRDIQMLNYMYDMSQTGKNIVKPKEKGLRTRSHAKRLFKLRKPKTEKYKKSLAYRGPRKWNDLPGDIQHLSTQHIKLASQAKKNGVPGLT